jgi:transposase
LLDYSLLFRGFVGLAMDEPVCTPNVFTRNRDRVLNPEIARSFFRRVVKRAEGLMSDEHITVNGTLIEACAKRLMTVTKGRRVFTRISASC